MKSGKKLFIPGLAAGIALGLAIFFIIAGFSGLAGGNRGGAAHPVLLEIPGCTNILEASVTPESGVAGELESVYGPLNIPRTVKIYDIVQFDAPSLWNTEVLIRGKGYNLLLERMNFESIDDGIDSYSGKVAGTDDSVVLLTLSGNIVTGSIEFAGETIFISPVQNRENAEKTKMPLHIVYSSKEMEQPGIFGVM